MKTSSAIHYFGGKKAAVARAAGINRSAVAQWGEIVPLASAIRIEKITGGALALDLDDYFRKMQHDVSQ